MSGWLLESGVTVDGVSVSRRCRGSISLSRLDSSISVDSERFRSTAAGGGGGGGGVLSVIKCTLHSFIFFRVITCCTPSRTVTVEVFSMILQSRHLEGGQEASGAGVGGRSPETGSRAGQDMDACLVPQKMQKFGVALLTTRDFPA